jgi:hypothetical protein
MADTPKSTNTPTVGTSLHTHLLDRINILPASNKRLDHTFTDVSHIIAQSQTIEPSKQVLVATKLHNAIFHHKDAYGHHFDIRSREAVLYYMADVASHIAPTLTATGATGPTHDGRKKEQLLRQATNEIFIHFPPVPQSAIDEVEKVVARHNEVVQSIVDGKPLTSDQREIKNLVDEMMERDGGLVGGIPTKKTVDHIPWMEQDVRFARLVLSVIEASHRLDDEPCQRVLADLHARASRLDDVTPMGTSIKELIAATLDKATQHTPRFEPIGYDRERFQEIQRNGYTPAQLSIDLVVEIDTLRQEMRTSPTQAHLDQLESIMERGAPLLGQLQHRVTKTLMNTAFAPGNSDCDIVHQMQEAVLHYSIAYAHNHPDSAEALRASTERVLATFRPAVPDMLNEYIEFGIGAEKWFLEDMRFTRMTLAVAAKAHELDDAQCNEVLRMLDAKVRKLDHLSPLGESVQKVVNSTSTKALEHSKAIHGEVPVVDARARRGQPDITRSLFREIGTRGSTPPSSSW